MKSKDTKWAEGSGGREVSDLGDQKKEGIRASGKTLFQETLPLEREASKGGDLVQCEVLKVWREGEAKKVKRAGEPLGQPLGGPGWNRNTDLPKVVTRKKKQRRVVGQEGTLK